MADSSSGTDRAAVEARINAELERPLRKALYKGERFIVRTVRIGLGGALVGSAYALVKQFQIGDKPIGSLTLNEIFAAISSSLVGVLLVVVALKVAFGTYDRGADIANRAQTIVDDDTRKKRERERVAKYYEKSKLSGILHDPELGLHGRPWLQVLLLVGVIGLLYGWLWFLASPLR